MSKGLICLGKTKERQGCPLRHPCMEGGLAKVFNFGRQVLPLLFLHRKAHPSVEVLHSEGRLEMECLNR